MTTEVQPFLKEEVVDASELSNENDRAEPAVAPIILVKAPKPQGLESLKGEELAQAFAALVTEFAYGLHALARLGNALATISGGTGDSRNKQRIYEWTIGSVLSIALNPETIRYGSAELHHVFAQSAQGVSRDLLQIMRRPLLTVSVDYLRRDTGVVKRIESDIVASRALVECIIAEFRLREPIVNNESKALIEDNLELILPDHTAIVLSSIGDMQSAEGQDAANRFGKLLLPLPLKGVGLDANQIWQSLQNEFPWMVMANLHVAQSIALSNLGNRAFKSAPVLLVGPPGIGKTRWGKRVSEIAGLGFAWLNFSGLSSSMSVIGNERGYKGARPGFAASSINSEATANPLLMLDEVDKATQGGQNGDPIAALLPLMESGTARRFTDNFLLAELDLSWISWVLTANDIRMLPDPLINRLKIIHVSAPDIIHLPDIIQRMLVEFAQEHQLPVDIMPNIGDAIPALSEIYINTRSLRHLNNALKSEVLKRLWYPTGFEKIIDAAASGFKFGFTSNQQS